MTSAYARAPVRTDSGGGGGDFQDNPTGGKECHIFLGGNRAVNAFGQPAFFFVGTDRMTIAAFEKKAYLGKRLFDSTEVLNLRKNT